jgi:putative transposase
MPAIIMWSGVRAYRRKVLVPPLDERLKQIMCEVCEEHQAEIEELEVMPDHVHLLVSVDPQFGVHCLMKLVKGRSSRFLRQECACVETKIADFVDELVFCQYDRGSAAL